MAPTATDDVPTWCKISKCDCQTKQDSVVRLTLSEYASEGLATSCSDTATWINPGTSVYCCFLSGTHLTVPSDAICTRVDESQPWILEYNPTFENDSKRKSTQKPESKSGYQKLNKEASPGSRETLALDTSGWELVMPKTDLTNPKSSQDGCERLGP